MEAEPRALAALEKLPGVAGVGLAQTYEPASSSGDGEALSPEDMLRIWAAGAAPRKVTRPIRSLT